MRVGWIILFLIGVPGFVSGQTATSDTGIWYFPEFIERPFVVQDSLPKGIQACANQGFWKPDGRNSIPSAALVKHNGLVIHDDKNYTFVLESYDGKNSFEGISTLFSSHSNSKGNWRKQVAAVEFTETSALYEIVHYSFYNAFGKTQSFLLWKKKDEKLYRLYHYALIPNSFQWKIIQKGRIVSVFHDPISSVSYAEIQLFNLSGIKLTSVKVIPGQGQTTIPTGTMPTGIYIIGFSVNDQTETRRVFIPDE